MRRCRPGRPPPGPRAPEGRSPTPTAVVATRFRGLVQRCPGQVRRQTPDGPAPEPRTGERFLHRVLGRRCVPRREPHRPHDALVALAGRRLELLSRPARPRPRSPVAGARRSSSSTVDASARRIVRRSPRPALAKPTPTPGPRPGAPHPPSSASARAWTTKVAVPWWSWCTATRRPRCDVRVRCAPAPVLRRFGSPPRTRGSGPTQERVIPAMGSVPDGDPSPSVSSWGRP